MRTLAGHLQTLLGIGKRRRMPFEQLFDRFRAVLDSNNRSLEIMTGMGDVLGGDYLFDVQYVKTASADLSASLNDSLRTFDELTQGRYPRLHDVVSRIDGTIRRVVSETPHASRDLVISFERITAELAPWVGGKSANLGLLRNAAQVSVPEGFAVTTHAYDSFMRHNRIFEKAGAAAGVPLPTSAREELAELALHGEVPPDLARALDKAVSRLKGRCGRNCFLSVRSSAGEEDGDFSFAGQFETVLNVPLEREAVEKAYRKVVASLFSEKAAAYQERLGYAAGTMKMAAACMVMVDAAVSGVLYTSDSRGQGNSIVIDAAWGLGPSVVEGTTDTDHYVLGKDGAAAVLEERIGEKDSMVVPREGGGIETVAVPGDLRGKACLTRDQLAELGRLGVAIEKSFQRPQDVEWAIDRSGRLFILQSRPLRLPGASPVVSVADAPDAPVILKDKGLVVQKGAVAGRVFVLKSAGGLDAVPEGAVLVARHDSSSFVRVMPKLAAIVTDRGALTSHMASLSREFRVPTVVNAEDATKKLVHGEEVTVLAGDSGFAVYRGRVNRLLEHDAAGAPIMEDLHEFREKRYLLRHIMPLNLVDPLRDDFTPGACRTVHDVLRFIHEKSVARLIEAAGYGLKTGRTVSLALSVPAGIRLIDIGGGLENPEGRDRVGPDHISSIPLRPLVAGMTRPGAWQSEAVSLTVNDFMTSMFRAPDITADGAGRAGSNVAVISREYLNLSLKFGYHFTIVDCYCSPNARNNHLYFRFAGGATDITKRSRRLRVIAAVLEESGFAIKTKGDLIIARLANVPRDEMEKVLDLLGRLISYTRQLDAVLQDDDAVERSIRNFREGRYGPGTNALQ